MAWPSCCGTSRYAPYFKKLCFPEANPVLVAILKGITPQTFALDGTKGITSGKLPSQLLPPWFTFPLLKVEVPLLPIISGQTRYGLPSAFFAGYSALVWWGRRRKRDAQHSVDPVASV